MKANGYTLDTAGVGKPGTFSETVKT